MRRLLVTLGLLGWMTAPAAAEPAPAKQALLWDHLRADIEAIEHRLDGVLGIAILDLTTGTSLLVHADEVFPQASTIKIAVLAELYREASEAAHGTPGMATLTDHYVVRAADLVPDSAVLGGLTPGVTTLTNRDLATIMVAVSDNSATNILIDRLGMDRVTALAAAAGLPHTQLRRKMMDLAAASEGRENVSTPREMMRLLELLYRGSIVPEPLRGDFFDVLATRKDGWLTREVPEGVRVANKPGELEGVRNDAGVVFLPRRPYVIVVMGTYLTNERAGEEAISGISAATYRMFDRLDRASPLGRVISPANGGPH